MSLWFIVNSASAKVAKKGALLPQYVQEFGAALRDVGNFSKVDELALEALERGASHIVIEGGDGTVHGVLTAFLKMCGDKPMPDFTIIAGGNTNQVARNIGIISATHAGLARALSDSAQTISFPLLHIHDGKGEDAFGFLFSTGALPQVTDYTTSQLHSKGLGGGAAVIGGLIKGLSGTGGITKLTPIELSLKTDTTEKMSGTHFGSIVTTLPSLMLKLDPFWGSGERPLRVSYVSGDYKKLARHTASLWRGNKSKDRRADGLHSWTAEQLDYVYSGPCVLDGETLALSPRFTISVTAPVRFKQ